MAAVGPFQTIPQLLARRAGATPSAVAFMSRDAAGVWQATCWGPFYRSVEQLAAKLRSHGLRPGDQVALLMPNSVQWETIQHAVYRLGGVVVGLDLNDPAPRMQEIFTLCSPAILFVDHLDRLKQIPAHVLGRISVITTGGTPGEKQNGTTCSVISLGELVEERTTTAPDIGPQTVAAILFTSGTTGRPKSLSFTHQQLALAVHSIIEHFSHMPDQAHTACWLPLANPFQRIINFCAMALNWQAFMVSAPGTIMADVKEIAPHLFAAVPRFYEKLHDGIHQGIDNMPRGTKLLARWALGAARTHRQAMASGRKPPWPQQWSYWVANRLVLRKIRRVMGANLHYFISGSAAMGRNLIEAFDTLGWQVLEAYGISENIVPMTMNVPGAVRPGSVGRPLAANSLRIAGDGEILVKGRGVAAQAALTDEGFLKTGDTGTLDQDGYLWLTGRKSDMFKLSTGRKVIPQAIEEAISQIEGVEHCLALGGNRKFVAVLLNVPRTAWDSLVAKHNDPGGALAHLRTQCRQACRHLPQYCQPVDIVVVHDTFSPGTGELTTNLKLRRKIILDKYVGAIEDLYREIENRKDEANPFAGTANKETECLTIS